MKQTIPRTMKALVYHGKNQLTVEEVPVPRIASTELLVKVEICGVCPTDIKKIVGGTVSAPRIFGHETAGTLVKVGSAVSRWKVGMKVALHHHVPCLKCHYCRHKSFAQCAGYKKTGISAGFEPSGGGFSEYVRVMPFVFPGIVPIPEGNEFTEGAMLEPVNTVLKAVRRLKLMAGDRVLVVGQGPIGLLFTRILALEGIRVVATDLFRSRLKKAREWGAERVIDANHSDWMERVADFGQKTGIDAAVIAVPVDAVVRDCLKLVRGGGVVILFAHTVKGREATVDFGTICAQEKDLVGSYSADFELQEEVARLVFSRKIDVRKLVSHFYSLDNSVEAIRLAAAPTEESMKILVGSAGGGVYPALINNK